MEEVDRKGGQKSSKSGQEVLKGGQEILNDTQNASQSDTQNDTKNQRMKLYIFETNFGNSCKEFNKCLLDKRKRRLPAKKTPQSLFFLEAKRV